MDINLSENWGPDIPGFCCPPRKRKNPLQSTRNEENLLLYLPTYYRDTYVRYLCQKLNYSLTVCDANVREMRLFLDNYVKFHQVGKKKHGNSLSLPHCSLYIQVGRFVFFL